MTKYKKKILSGVIIGVVIYLGISVYLDFEKVGQSLARFNLLIIAPLLLLSLINYFFRFLKWDYYLKKLNVKLAKTDSFLVFIAGMVMSVSPGKSGEVLKSFLVKEINGTPVSRTAPVIFAERLTDFFALIILSVIGAFVFDYGKEISLATLIFFIFLIVIISQKRIFKSILEWLEKIKFIAKYASKIEELYLTSYELLRLGPLVGMILLSIVSWSFECYSFYVVIKSYGYEPGVFLGSFIYAFGTIVGALSFLPGGLGVTEGSFTLMLTGMISVNSADSLAITFIIRLATLWFAVFAGVIALSALQKKYYKINTEQAENSGGI
ncbi:MAG: flippase-like domain-containing protein [Ignavibacteriaceae bacterium]|nr:flippase-like domain-containing protein [Ignavibacteriaceae bacterium]